MVLWVCGILIMNNAPAPYQPPLEDLDRYDQLTAKADTMRTAIEAEQNYWIASRNMNQAKGFFWNDPTYESKRRVYEQAKDIYLRENAKRQSHRTTPCSLWPTLSSGTVTPPPTPVSTCGLFTPIRVDPESSVLHPGTLCGRRPMRW